MPASHARRFASQGLLERRRPAAGVNCFYERQVPTRPAHGAPWYPVAPLPPGLLPLPVGFTLAIPSVPATAAS
ncbi:hypothetical protein [Streptomyces sp. NPDC095817]|uniref:hypothetical protein n=1 Tax=unclassified Streptomyces TaxID=2593676 RepID=UPI003318782B